MELIKEIVNDFILFSLIESYILCLFLKNVGRCKKFNFYEILFVGLINSIVSFVLPQLIFQLFVVIFLIFIASIRDKKAFKDSFVVSTFAITYLMILEVMYSLTMSMLLGIETFDCGNVRLFLIIIPLRFIEIFLLKKGDFMMKQLKLWIGEVEKPEKEEVKEVK